jgi:hypothetical protein
VVASAPEPQPLVRDVLLRDGSTLRLQSPTPVDFDDIKASYDGLSPSAATSASTVVGERTLSRARTRRPVALIAWR